MTAGKHHWSAYRFAPVLAALALVLACTPGMRQTKTRPEYDASPPMLETPASTIAPTIHREKKATPEDSPGFFVHKVRWERESLSIIAKWYTGHMRNWKLLAQRNPMYDPNRIRIGDEIMIPEKLLRTRDPLPKSFVDRYAPKPKGPAEVKPPPLDPQAEVPQAEAPQDELPDVGVPKDESPEEQAPKDEPPELFGPKEYKEYKAPQSRREKGGFQNNPLTPVQG